MKYCKSFLTVGAVIAFMSSLVQAEPLKPYDGAPPDPLSQISAADKLKLDDEQGVKRQIETADGGRAVKMFRVHAPADIIWKVILDFKKYPIYTNNQIARLIEYKRRDGDNIYVRFTLGLGMLGEWSYSIIHNYPIKEGWGTWKLDTSEGIVNNIDGSVGFWRVTPVPGKSDQCDVTYSVDLQVSGWIVNMIKSIVIEKGLDEATRWVREYSVKEYQRRNVR